MKKEDLNKAIGRFEESVKTMENSRLLIDQSSEKVLEECLVEIPVCGDHESWGNKG